MNILISKDILEHISVLLLYNAEIEKNCASVSQTAGTVESIVTTTIDGVGLKSAATT